MPGKTARSVGAGEQHTGPRRGPQTMAPSDCVHIPVLRAEREHHAVVGGGRLQLEIEGDAEALAQHEPERPVEAPAERRVHDGIDDGSHGRCTDSAAQRGIEAQYSRRVAADDFPFFQHEQIGRASCRERV